MGIGNESWDCGGNMTADYYLSQLKVYSHFVRNDDPSQQGPGQMLKIAVGPGFPETEWTETIMKAWEHHHGSWDIDGLSLHWYTVPNGWPPSTPSTGFGVDDYVKVLKSTMTVKAAKGETLTAPAVDSVNTFAVPNTVVPKPISASVKGGRLALMVAPKAVTVIALEP